MLFEDTRVVPVELPVAAGSQPGQTCPDVGH